MKKCQTCGNQNADDMRFCLNCGSALPDAPVVVNFGGGSSQGGQSNPGTNPYGKSQETQFNRPVFQQPPQQNYSMVPPQNKSGGSKKLLIAIGGVVALFFLILVAAAGIIGYNMMKDPKPVVNNSPTPTVSPTGSPSASPSPSASKSASPTPRPSEAPKSSVTGAKAKFDKIWVDYNVTEEGEKGMRIHVKFEVTGMEGVDSYLMVYFQKSDGTDLKTSSSVYGSKDGRVVAKVPLKPGYATTVYKDLDVFMPYSELNLTPGKYNLKMDADLADNDELLIQHLGYKEFEYEKF